MVMPKMGESIMEGTILKWRKKQGEKVEKDENVLDIATDKVDAEVPATEAGTLAEILVQEGETVAVGAVIARIETGANAATGASPSAEPPASAASTPTSTAPEANSPVPASEIPGAKPADVTANGTSGNGKPHQEAEPAEAAASVAASAGSSKVGSEASTEGRFYSPVVMNVAQQEGVSMQELSQLKGTGTAGRVTKSDLMNYLQAKKSGASQPGSSGAAAPKVSETQVAPSGKIETPKQETPASAPAKPASGGHAAPPVVYDASRSEVIAMDNMRKLIAEHMVRSKQTSAHVTSVSEADVTKLVKLVKARKVSFEQANGVKLTYTPFFIDAIVKTLKQFPMVNASVDGDKIIIKKYINLGMAVALGENGAGGLIVPVIKNADEKNLVGLARSVNDLASRARVKKLLPDDIQGGTFTITNYGTSGNLFGSPIINQPQVAILGTGAIVKKPVVVTDADGNDSIAIRSAMYLSLSYDHRIIDGSLAGYFLQTLCRTLESYDDQTIL